MRIAVALHLLDYELLEEFQDWLSNVEPDHDLFVTVPDNGDQVLELFPDAFLFKHHVNQGMDVGGFFRVLPALFGKYDYVLKLHSKSCNEWRKKLIGPICGSPETVELALRKFEDATVGAVGSNGALLNIAGKSLGPNARYVAMLSAEYNVPVQGSFVGGTMFWMRVSILEQAFRGKDLKLLIASLNTPLSCDWLWYLRYYPDLVEAGVTTKEKALVHWAVHGSGEGRFPNGLVARSCGKEIVCDGMIEHAYERLFGMIIGSTGWVGLEDYNELLA